MDLPEGEPGRLLSRDDVAQLLGIAPESVRSTMRRHGIVEQRGYPADQVAAIRRLGRGHRSDLDDVR